jgi:hypothetical protein
MIDPGSSGRQTLMLRLSRLLQGAGGFRLRRPAQALAAVGVGGQTLTPVSLIDGFSW